MTMFGIDISSWQSGLNIKKTEAEFAIMKATDGVRFVDSACDKFVQQCIASGVLWGFYHFANSPYKASMEDQARYFVDNCKNYFTHGIPVLDWEDSAEQYGGPVIKHGPDMAKRWLDEVYRLTGVRAMIYMSASVAKAYDWSEVAKDYALWGAGYPGNATYSNPQTDIYGWGAWEWPAVHQYSSDGGLDKNIAYMDADAWMKFANPTSKDTSELAKEVLAGVWGNGSDRRAKLEAAGHDYQAVQAEVNRLCGLKAPTGKTIAQVANEVIRGEWGNGQDRYNRLSAAGYNPREVQAEVNRILS